MAHSEVSSVRRGTARSLVRELLRQSKPSDDAIIGAKSGDSCARAFINPLHPRFSAIKIGKSLEPFVFDSRMFI
jgi:hypothetical protein